MKNIRAHFVSFHIRMLSLKQNRTGMCVCVSSVFFFFFIPRAVRLTVAVSPVRSESR